MALNSAGVVLETGIGKRQIDARHAGRVRQRRIEGGKDAAQAIERGGIGGGRSDARGRMHRASPRSSRP